MDRALVHRGIAARWFERRFVLGDYVQVRGAELKDGLLVELVREVRDEVQPRKIKLGATSGTQLVEAREDASRSEVGAS